MIHPESWPTDPRECHDLLQRFTQQVDDLQAVLDQAAKLHDQVLQEHELTVQGLRHQLELYRRYVFGPRRERLVEAPGQGHLFELDLIETITTPLPEPPAGDPGAALDSAVHASRIMIDYLKSASSTTYPRPRRSARIAEKPRHASARMRHACWR